MFRRMASAVALAAAMVGGAQAAVINAGESLVFNFSNPGASLGAVNVAIIGFSQAQGETGSITYLSGLNLEGDIVYVDLAPSTLDASDRRSDSRLLDSFSILITITSGSFNIDPVASYGINIGTSLQVGTLGSDNRVTPPTTTVPEPASLALVALAGLAGITAIRRRRA